MNTRKYNNKWASCIVSCLMLLSCSAFCSCDDELDIVPKGKSTLESVSDLEALLNTEYGVGNVPAPCEDIAIICNESLGQWTSVGEMMAQRNTVEYAHMAYDESVDRADLTNTNDRYTAFYKYINNLNVVISKMPDATGDGSKKDQFIAEARILRAYFHWLLVNIHAKQYDDATAENEGGIAYVDNTNVGETKEKLSLAETYNRILEDCSEEVIAKLPQKNTNVERPDQAFGNAMRAMVLMQMKHYAEALPFAQTAIRLNNLIQDRSEIMTTMSWSLSQSMENNLLYVAGGTRISPTFVNLSLETSAMFEEGDYVVNYDLMGGWQPSWTSGDELADLGCLQYLGWDTSGNVYGITSDHVYYVLAECLIRTGQIRQGLEYVDRVRAKRVENYEPFAKDGLSEQQAMALLQKAKWIECIGTYENFFDCKRWNSEANYKRTITRNLGSYGTFTLRPESPLWVLPFPSNVTRYNPTMTQNY